MSDKKADDKNVIFELERNYPETKGIFGIRRKPIEEVLDTCDIVLDTNVLLLPYETTSESFERIRELYTKLKDRLFIPERVAREFARKRPESLKRLINKLSTHRKDAAIPGALKIPILSDELETLKPVYEQLVEAKKAYYKAFDEIKAKVDLWEHNDPVMDAYRELFGQVTILELSLNEDEILERLESRYARKMPPGYADQQKDDKGVGDLVIWLCMLEQAKRAKNDMIFVTADSKQDWQHQVDKKGFMPRVELVNEYALASDGRCIYMMPLSELLRLNDVEADDIEQVEEIVDVSNVAKLVGPLIAASVTHLQKAQIAQERKSLSKDFQATIDHAISYGIDIETVVVEWFEANLIKIGKAFGDTNDISFICYALGLNSFRFGFQRNKHICDAVAVRLSTLPEGE